MPQNSNDGQASISYKPLVQDAIVLTGPTASGKSATAIALAQIINGEIISLDSIAVYRGMDIGSAKPTIEDQRAVPHHLIDLVEPTEDFSVACYLSAAHATVEQIRQRGRHPIFVGGTPMFLKGVLRGFDPGPPADWSFRKAVESDLESHGIEALRQRLQQVDPLAAHRIGPNDARRMIRALEVSHQTGVPISHRQIQFDHYQDPNECNVFTLNWQRSHLHERINKRVEQMFEDGFIAEVRSLLEAHGTLSRTAAQAVGYREIMEWISKDGENTNVLTEEVSAHTRQLARRQETWLRSFAERRIIDVGKTDEPEAIAQRIAQNLFN
ncbi:MAG: tRNA (adenosine(37)-N6)-dimethylallyltransferase MiaA [Rhodopirellula sp.]|nr:tRNA (adenosine(37)-N6)-dimethylallyltransferase MiaA [Rhodopirellula sp.]OUX50750.1 MAG: tRNA (adenosine(37)-N6)-dimethylallyltransferase MiaA [Rhodopirellula sp. TMED283]